MEGCAAKSHQIAVVDCSTKQSFNVSVHPVAHQRPRKSRTDLPELSTSFPYTSSQCSITGRKSSLPVNFARHGVSGTDHKFPVFSNTFQEPITVRARTSEEYTARAAHSPRHGARRGHLPDKCWRHAGPHINWPHRPIASSAYFLLHTSFQQAPDISVTSWGLPGVWCYGNPAREASWGWRGWSLP